MGRGVKIELVGKQKGYWYNFIVCKTVPKTDCAYMDVAPMLHAPEFQSCLEAIFNLYCSECQYSIKITVFVGLNLRKGGS